MSAAVALRVSPAGYKGSLGARRGRKILERAGSEAGGAGAAALRLSRQ